MFPMFFFSLERSVWTSQMGMIIFGVSESFSRL